MKISSRFIKASIELFGLTLLALDLLYFKQGILAGVSLAYFVLDYLWYRREAVLDFRKSKDLREGMTLQDIQAIERDYSLREDFNSFEKHAQVRSPLDRYFYYEKYEKIRDLLLSYGSKGGLWLDLGCGFGEDTFYMVQHLSQKAIGLELDEIKLFRALDKYPGHHGFPPVAFLVGDALHPPFQPQKFDTILMTEVLEHLIHPEDGIKRCHFLLKEGGVLILSTPSLHNLGYSMNPFLILEKAISLLDDRVLPPYHGLHAQFEYDWRRPEPRYGIHYHFSQKGLRGILTRNQFQILWEGSFEIEISPFLAMELLARGDVGRMRKLVQPVEKILERVPLINRLGQHLLFVARKKN